MSFNEGRALVIGVGSYMHKPKLNVPITVSDAKAVSEVLYNTDLCGYLPQRVNLLHDNKASRDGVLGALDALAMDAEEGNTVVLYYCGHGFYGTDGNYYLTTSDTEFSGSKVKMGTGISESDLLDKLRVIPAKKLLLFFNACHSGEISPALGPEDPEESFEVVNLPSETTGALLSSGEGRIIITASRSEQSSWIGKGELTIFTQALVDGLSGKGYVSNNNGYISAFSLYEHMFTTVKDGAAELGKTQEPEITVLKGVGPFPVSLYRGATDLGSFDAQESPPKGTAVNEIDSETSERLFTQIIRTTIASGDGAISVGGNVSGSTFSTGDQVTNVDKIVEGDEVHGDKVGGDQITVGDISGSTGVAIGRGAESTVTEGISGKEVERLFASIFAQIEARPEDPDVGKEEIKTTVQNIQHDVAKGEQASPKKIERWLKTLAMMAPDIFEVAVNTLIKPAAGIATAIRKVAEKAKGEAGQV